MAGNSTKGNCYLCGKTLGKTAMKNHILKEHAGNADEEAGVLFKIQGHHAKDYWLFLDLPKTATLSTLDKFLRTIWLECCGHMSAFLDGYDEIGQSRKIGSLPIGAKFGYEYDFGTTTALTIEVIAHISRPKQKKAVRLLARNEPPEFVCDCGKPAVSICQECIYESDNPLLCEECSDEHDHEDMLLPVTNSPRMGDCAYEGDSDIFAFVPFASEKTGKATSGKKASKKI